MAFVSRIRLRFRSGTGQYLERFYADTFVPGRQALFARGELLSIALLRIEVPGDQAETYDLVSYWANKATHDRNEDSPLDQLGVTTSGGISPRPGMRSAAPSAAYTCSGGPYGRSWAYKRYSCR